VVEAAYDRLSKWTGTVGAGLHGSASFAPSFIAIQHISCVAAQENDKLLEQLSSTPHLALALVADVPA
jgi:hypothetical protein